MNVLVIIPARGGSKGIPRKNLRALAGKPLLYYSVKNALSLTGNVDVYVSSDDEEILFFAQKFGAKTYLRNEENATDVATLDPVIFEAYQKIKGIENKKYDLVVTMQATSPLLESNSVQTAIDKMSADLSIDTIISSVNDTHLSWTKNNSGFVPLYKERLNRQYLPPSYKETGGFLITRNSIISDNNRIGKNVELYELKEQEAIDIDTYADWNLCEYYLQHKIIVFSLVGNNTVGLGHAYNCMTLASQILNHRLVFVFDKDSKLGYQKVLENNYEAYVQTSENIVEDIMVHHPDLVINDCLDTSVEYMTDLKSRDVKLLNIEDLGEGVGLSDIVVNAIYPELEDDRQGHFFGPKYFCIRDEFYLAKPIEIQSTVKSVLLTFGGVDPNNLTHKVLDSIYDFCKVNEIEITIVLGLGYTEVQSLKGYDSVTVHRNVSSISDFMMAADIAFTSAGRTTYELACIGVPSIVMSQNHRETTHFFTDEVNGFKNLGLGELASQESILAAFKELVESANYREKMQAKMMRNDIRSGRDRVINMINDLFVS